MRVDEIKVNPLIINNRDIPVIRTQPKDAKKDFINSKWDYSAVQQST